MGKCLILAKVVGVQNSSVLYPCCAACYSKVHHDSADNCWICLKCPGSSGRRFPLYRYRITLTITDCDTICDVSVFGTKLDLFFGVNANEFNRILQHIEESNDQLVLSDLLQQALCQTFVGQFLIFGFHVSIPKSKRSVEKRAPDSLASVKDYFTGSTVSANFTQFSSRDSGLVAWQMTKCSEKQIISPVVQVMQMLVCHHKQDTFTTTQNLCANTLDGSSLTSICFSPDLSSRESILTIDISRCGDIRETISHNDISNNSDTSDIISTSDICKGSDIIDILSKNNINKVSDIHNSVDSMQPSAHTNSVSIPLIESSRNGDETDLFIDSNNELGTSNAVTMDKKCEQSEASASILVKDACISFGARIANALWSQYGEDCESDWDGSFDEDKTEKIKDLDRKKNCMTVCDSEKCHLQTPVVVNSSTSSWSQIPESESLEAFLANTEQTNVSVQIDDHRNEKASSAADDSKTCHPKIPMSGRKRNCSLAQRPRSEDLESFHAYTEKDNQQNNPHHSDDNGDNASIHQQKYPVKCIHTYSSSWSQMPESEDLEAFLVNTETQDHTAADTHSQRSLDISSTDDRVLIVTSTGKDTLNYNCQKNTAKCDPSISGNVSECSCGDSLLKAGSSALSNNDELSADLFGDEVSTCSQSSDISKSQAIFSEKSKGNSEEFVIPESEDISLNMSNCQNKPIYDSSVLHRNHMSHFIPGKTADISYIRDEGQYTPVRRLSVKFSASLNVCNLAEIDYIMKNSPCVQTKHVMRRHSCLKAGSATEATRRSSCLKAGSVVESTHTSDNICAPPTSPESQDMFNTPESERSFHQQFSPAFECSLHQQFIDLALRETRHHSTPVNAYSKQTSPEQLSEGLLFSDNSALSSLVYSGLSDSENLIICNSRLYDSEKQTRTVKSLRCNAVNRTGDGSCDLFSLVSPDGSSSTCSNSAASCTTDNINISNSVRNSIPGKALDDMTNIIDSQSNLLYSGSCDLFDDSDC